MSKCTNNNINISSSTNIVDDVSNDIEKLTTATDESDATSTKSEEKCKLKHIKTDNTSSNNNDNFEQDIVQENTGSNLEASDICANCGKEGASNTCNKCKQVKYCNAACKKKHKKKHKKECEEHLRRAAELHDEKLFKRPPPSEEECPICLVRLPNLTSGSRYQSCCGKTICSGCIHAMKLNTRGRGNALCPFCRAPTPNTENEIIKRAQRRVKLDDAEAMHILGGYYSSGICGLPQDYAKALELWHRGVELGNATAYHNIANAYYFGDGVEVDKKRGRYYWELAAMKGDVDSRHNLGLLEGASGNEERAFKHFMIAVEGGYKKSLPAVRDLYKDGYATKDDYAKALRAYQKYLGEIKSSQRDEAAAANEGYKYIEK